MENPKPVPFKNNNLGNPFSMLTYYLIAIGAVSPSLLSMMACGEGYIEQPLQNSSQYMLGVKKLSSIQQSLVNQLAKLYALDNMTVSIHRFRENMAIEVEPRNLTDMLVMDRTPMPVFPTIGEIAKRLNDMYVITYADNFAFPSQLGSHLQFHFLKTMGLIAPNNKHQEDSSCLSFFHQILPSCASGFVVLLTLLKDDLLNADPIVPTSTQQSADPFNEATRLIFRFLSCFPSPLGSGIYRVQFKNLAHYSCTAFSSIVNLYLAIARQTYDVLFLSLIQDHADTCQKVLNSDSLSVILSSHPFQYRPSNIHAQLVAAFVSSADLTFSEFCKTYYMVGHEQELW
eukprot:CAMPEP_0117418738 /NCGR_PEP_ID=MMETSP0758-20121206/452_1 /TAXON_ID=63605 /ORGANISM="Percolomonas cosmopolitus, Strain AE-1 (ATCC 50343)" /LENGTH=342 /DNA_ID=CAMNT_0005199407 /DNA_START=944 /DNA_END=1969 /DNA_ORIENTATION=+